MSTKAQAHGKRNGTRAPIMDDEDAHARDMERLRAERDAARHARNEAWAERNEARRVAAALWSTLRRCAASRACDKQPWNELDERIEDALALVPTEWRR